MIKLLVTWICIITCAPAIFAADISMNNSNKNIIIKEKIFSFAGKKDGSIIVLAEGNKIIEVSPNGSQTNIYLPKIIESKPGDNFCDLTVEGDSIYLCGFPFPVIFEWNKNKPEEYQIIRATDQEAAKLNIINVNKVAGTLKIIDADGYLFELKHEKPLKKLSNRALINADSKDKSLQIPEIKFSETQPLNERVIKRNGKAMWIVPAPKAPKRIKSIEFLGKDRQNRHIFLVMTGSGELDSEFCLYAIENGEIAASQIIDGPTNLEIQHFCRLSPDGTILHAKQLNKTGEGIILTKIKL